MRLMCQQRVRSGEKAGPEGGVLSSADRTAAQRSELNRGQEAHGMGEEPRTTYLAVGDRMPDVQLPRLGGGDFAFTSLRGRFALLYLWASW